MGSGSGGVSGGVFVYFILQMGEMCKRGEREWFYFIIYYKWVRYG